MSTGYQKGFLYRARFTQSQIEDMLHRAQDQLIETGPESILSWSDNGTSTSKRPELTVSQWLDEIIYSLALLDPAKYGDREAQDVTQAAFPRRFE
jgi:hypothetical protein